jgi:hypothetical protein
VVVLIVELLTNASSGDMMMIRFYLAAIVVVVLVGGLLAAHRFGPPNLRIVGPASGTPSVESSVRPEPPRTPPPFTGSGSWVLSALPACFDERSRQRGPAAALAAKLPLAGERIAAPATFAVGPCTLHVEPHEVWVTRGPDRLRVPPDAALYRVAGRLVLVVRSGPTVEIRRY